MGRKSKIELEKEFKKARLKYMKHAREFERCHTSSPRYDGLRTKCIEAEEQCFLLLRKIYNIKKGQPDKLIP